MNQGTGVQVGLAISTPLVAALVVVLRLDELQRVVKAGAHIAVLEKRIAQEFPDDGPPLTWETNIQDEFRFAGDSLRHWVIAVTLFAASVPAVLLGVANLAGDDRELALQAVAAIAILTTAYQLWVLVRVSGWHSAAKAVK